MVSVLGVTLVERSPTFVLWRKVGYQAYRAKDPNVERTPIKSKLSPSQLSVVYLLNFEERSIQHVAPAQHVLHMQPT